MSENLTTNVELDSTANGTVSFATDVVATIAGLAATEVEGVAAMINNGNLGLVDMLRKNQGNRTMTRGVKVEINGNQVRVQAERHRRLRFARAHRGARDTGQC